MSNNYEALSQPVAEFKKCYPIGVDSPPGGFFQPLPGLKNVKPGDHLYSQGYVTALLNENQYLKVKIKEMDLLFGGMLLTMQAAVIEMEHGEGSAAAMQWIFNKLLGPGEFAPDAEKDAQTYFNRESEKIDAEFAKCQEFYKQWREAKGL